MISFHIVVDRRKNDLKSTPSTLNLCPMYFMGVGDCEYIAEQRRQATGFDTLVWHATLP